MSTEGGGMESEVEVLGTRSDVWSDFSSYERLLWDVVWRWVGRFRGKYEPQELFNELVLAYVGYSNFYGKSLSRVEFGRGLWRTCWNRLVDMVRKEKVQISIDDVIVEASCEEWKELWGRFFIEDLLVLLKTDEGREMVGLVLSRRQELESVQVERRPIRKRCRSICKEDLVYYFVKRQGWEWKKVWLGLRDVERAITVLC